MIAGFVAAAMVAPLSLGAQVAPNLHWESIGSTHFRVTYSEGLAELSRRAAGSAERAYARLSAELAPPRGVVDIVLADNVDYTNGFAQLFPSPRIIIYVRPPIDDHALQFLDDWLDLVITHELTHIFHLDLSRGWWRGAQYLFGRNPFLFPSSYYPSWLNEGIAVYYESRLTGAGRTVGSEHSMIARARAIEGTTPRVNALSKATPDFPLGQTPYVYGSLLVDYLARTQGAFKVRRFIDESAGRSFPWLLNYNASTAFGLDFDRAFASWTDSIRRSVVPVNPALPKTRELTTRGWFAQRLRWASDSSIVYGRDDGRSRPVLALVNTGSRSGESRAVAERSSLDATALLADGSRIFAQLDFTDPYTVRSDLYRERDGATERLTNGARLTQPDARCAAAAGSTPCGAITVAVQLVAGSTRLVRVTGSTITPLTSTSTDTLWSDPRWSRDGFRIAAVRWTRGGTSEVAVLDATGKLLTTVGRTRGVIVAPSWNTSGDAIYFTSDRTGRSALYRAVLATGALERFAEAPTGLFESELSPDGKQIATLIYRGDGYHLALLPANSTGVKADSANVFPPSRRDTVATLSATATPYSPWRSLRPTYWIPAASATDEGIHGYGFITSGSDLVGRHEFSTIVTYEPQRHESSWDFSYAYAGLGNPTLGFGTSSDWDHFPVVDSTNKRLGTLQRRKRFVDLSATAVRSRIRSSAYVTLGAQFEWRDFFTDPTALKKTIGAVYNRTYTYPVISLSAGWGNALTPILGISPEDGFQMAVTARQRWRSDIASTSRTSSVVGYANAYKALAFGGSAHHVLALHAAAGFEDTKATTELEAGGVSGSILSVIPGVTVGEGRRTFFVRGFDAGAQRGIRALAGSAEYRAPLAMPAAGVAMLPVFLQKVNATVFADAATAWCPAGITGSTVCALKGSSPDWMASAGAELQLDTALQYDTPYRFRFGVATPIAGRKYFGKNSVAAYFSVGIPF